MSQQEDDLRSLAKIMDLLRGLSIVVVVANFYWFCHSLIGEWQFHPQTMKILNGLNEAGRLFSNPWNAKWWALLFLGLSCFGTKGVKNEKIQWIHIWIFLSAGATLFFLNWWMVGLGWHITYILTTSIGYVLLLIGGVYMSRLLKNNMMDDRFNEENESFMQETECKDNEYSINLPTRFYYKKKWNKGWINVVNPFRATIVLGTPGSGKSFAVVNNFIKQQIEKGFGLYVYDYKYPDLTLIAYNHMLNNQKGYGKHPPSFYVINFDDPEHSHRCNPIHPAFMTDIADAYESAYTIMMNLNRTWIQKQGDFFVESPIVLFAAIIWYLKLFEDGKYCTFPHAIEFLCRPYEQIFPILTSYPELENYLSPFLSLIHI